MNWLECYNVNGSTEIHRVNKCIEFSFQHSVETLTHIGAKQKSIVFLLIEIKWCLKVKWIHFVDNVAFLFTIKFISWSQCHCCFTSWSQPLVHKKQICQSTFSYSHHPSSTSNFFPFLLLSPTMSVSFHQVWKHL